MDEELRMKTFSHSSLRCFLSFVLLSLPLWAFDHEHKTFTALLQKHVVTTREGASSQVDYAVLKKDPSELNRYLSELSQVEEKTFQSFSESQQLAFLINAYNAFTLKTVVDFYNPDPGNKTFVLKSIRDICDTAKDCAWVGTGRVCKRKFFRLLGQEQSLDILEHGMLRKDYKEPRIHFAINCASIGCPKLASQAYTAAQLEEQLRKATLSFLSDETRNRYDKTKNTLYLSQIFSWFEEDFTKAHKSVAAFVAPYLGNPTKASIEYLPYNWNLNNKVH